MAYMGDDRVAGDNDFDGDGIPNQREVLLGTDPLSADGAEFDWARTDDPDAGELIDAALRGETSYPAAPVVDPDASATEPSLGPALDRLITRVTRDSELWNGDDDFSPARPLPINESASFATDADPPTSVRFDGDGTAAATPDLAFAPVADPSAEPAAPDFAFAPVADPYDAPSAPELYDTPAYDAPAESYSDSGYADSMVEG